MTVHLDPAPLFRGSVANAETKYVEVPVRRGAVGAQIQWKDATSSATVTLELTSNPGIAAGVAGAAHEWRDSGLSITGPVGSAAGSTVLNVENVRQRRARIKIVGAAASNFEIWDGTEP